MKPTLLGSQSKWINGKNAAAYAAERLVLHKNFFKNQNPRLINKSGFKSRAAYDVARTVYVKIGGILLKFNVSNDF